MRDPLLLAHMPGGKAFQVQSHLLARRAANQLDASNRHGTPFCRSPTVTSAPDQQWSGRAGLGRRGGRLPSVPGLTPGEVGGQVGRGRRQRRGGGRSDRGRLKGSRDAGQRRVWNGALGSGEAAGLRMAEDWAESGRRRLGANDGGKEPGCGALVHLSRCQEGEFLHLSHGAGEIASEINNRQRAFCVQSRAATSRDAEGAGGPFGHHTPLPRVEEASGAQCHQSVNPAKERRVPPTHSS